MTELPAFVSAARRAVPLHLLSEDALPSWLTSQPPAVRSWVKSNGFEGRCGQHLLVPGSGGAPSLALCGMAASPAFWDFAALPSSLPRGTYRLGGSLEAGLATKVAFGWALGGYAFTRYGKGKDETCARLVWPSGADPLRNPADVRRGRARARPDQHARRRSRTRGTGRGGQARRAGGRREMPGHRRRRAARAELPHDSRRGPGERPGAPTDRHAVGIGETPEGHDRGQGRLLRFRRPRSEAGVRHGLDEEGHGRRCRGAGARADDHGRRAQGSSARHDPGGREQRLGRQLPPPATC